MAVLVAFDDTDSPLGGCTTSLAASVGALFPELGAPAEARLVRLNPNVPWKTRGNGAVALLFSGSFDLDEALARLARFLSSVAQPHEGTSPGGVVSARPLDPAYYDAAVTRIVTREEADAAVAAADARAWGGRGVIGAAAALAWPARRATWELIAYRAQERIGSPRDVDPETVRRVETSSPALFDSFDRVEDEVVCVPSSPCPVLWGLRATHPEAPAHAAALLGPERPVRSTLFRTNHASDDHLRDRVVLEVRAFESARVRGHVAQRPREHGGHVFLEVEDPSGRLRCAAYAPTRSFRRVVQALSPGDEVTVAGGVHAGPDARLTLGLEKLQLHAAAPRKKANPVCPACARRMKSAGAGAGYRCRECGTRARDPETVPAPLEAGWYEVPASARRHLARPLRLDGL